MIKRLHLAATAGIALISAAVCSGAAITVLNPYTFSSQCQGVASLPNAGCSVSDASGSGSVQFGLTSATGPFVMATGISAKNGGFGFGDLQYQFLVTGPGKTALVDVNYLLSVAGSFSPVGFTFPTQAVQFTTGANFGLSGLPIASAAVNLNAFGGTVDFPPSFSDSSVNTTYSALTRTEAGSLSGPQTITVPTGLPVTVEMKVQASCGVQGGVGCTTSAVIDPTFTVDPNQANAGQYSISFSPGIGNGAPGGGNGGPGPNAVPEPASFLLLGGGLLGVGMRARRRRQVDETSSMAV